MATGGRTVLREESLFSKLSSAIRWEVQLASDTQSLRCAAELKAVSTHAIKTANLYGTVQGIVRSIVASLRSAGERFFRLFPSKWAVVECGFIPVSIYGLYISIYTKFCFYVCVLYTYTPWLTSYVYISLCMCIVLYHLCLFQQQYHLCVTTLCHCYACLFCVCRTCMLLFYST